MEEYYGGVGGELDDDQDQPVGQTTVTSLGISSAESLSLGKSSFAGQPQYGSKRDGLYRLIRSDLFDVWLGLAYLNKFRGETVGTHYLLCDQLRNVPLSDVEFVLPQLM